MSEHLDELALEALATGRDDLLPGTARTHLQGCAACRALVEEERESARDAAVGLRRAMPDVGDLDAMILRAMEAAPPAERSELLGAPSRSSLWTGAALGGVAAAALAILSMPGSSSMEGMTAAGRQGLTLARAIDSLVESAVPGGWGLVAVLGLVLALLLAVPMRLLLGDRRVGGAVATGALGLLAVLAVGAPTGVAHAYRVEGAWPEPERRVTLDADGLPTSEALRLAAESAGLGLVARLPDDPLVTLHVRDVPLPEVVQALLGDTPVVVIPGQSLLTVRAETPPIAPTVAPTTEPTVEPTVEPAVEPAVELAVEVPTVDEAPASEAAAREAAASEPSASPPPSAPTSTAGVGDRLTFGDDVEIGPDEVVRAVYTMGGDARIEGRALGDVVTMGGDAEVVGEVFGNVTTMGGDIAVRDGARVHGDLNAMGGTIDVGPQAVLHGQALRSGRRTPSQAALQAASREDDRGEGASTLYRWGLWHVLLFLLGLVMLGASRERLTVLRAELGARPIRSAFGGLFGLLAGSVLSVVLILTIIGSPGALVLGGLMFIGGCMGWTAAAAWLGSVLPLPFLKDRPVLQLGAGVGVLFLVGLVPTVGTLITVLVVMAGLGAVIATSFGTKKRPARPRHVPTGPFRRAAR